MKNGKRQHTAEFEAKMVLESLKETMSSTELASKFEIHPTQIAKWKKHSPRIHFRRVRHSQGA